MELYVATNYTRCPNRTSYLETKEFMIGSEHLLTLICVPLNIYCIYLIWFVTPPKMEGIKLPMLHLQLVSLSFDLIINSLMTPITYIPVPACSFHGLFSFLGIHPVIQFIIAHYNIFREFALFQDCSSNIKVMIIVIGMSVINIFQNRHSVTITIPHRLTNTSSLIIYYTLSDSFGTIIISLYFLDGFDNDALKLEYLKVYPCPPLEYFTSTVSLISNNIPRILFCIVSCIIFIVTSALYFAISTAYYLVIVPSTKVSEKTRQMQLRFLFMLSIQIVIPLTSLVVPCISIGLVYLTGLNCQIANNIFILMFCSHGLLSGIALIVIQNPYREYTFRLKKKQVIVTSEQSVALVRTNVCK